MPAEMRKLVKLWSDARSRGEECALATVVRVAGSSYRKPGARMLLTRGGQRVGTVSGGCLEGEVSRKIWWLTEQGPTVRSYSTSYDDDSQQSYGLGCDGVVTLLLERASQADPDIRGSSQSCSGASGVRNCDRHRQRMTQSLGKRLALAEGATFGDSNGHLDDLDQLLLPIARETLRTRQTRSMSARFHGGEIELFAEHIAPPPALFVFGAGDDAQPVVHLAHAMGWEITVADGRSNLATSATLSARPSRCRTCSRRRFAKHLHPARRCSCRAHPQLCAGPIDPARASAAAPQLSRSSRPQTQNRTHHRRNRALARHRSRHRSRISQIAGGPRSRRRFTRRNRALDRRRNPGGAHQPHRRAPQSVIRHGAGNSWLNWTPARR